VLSDGGTIIVTLSTTVRNVAAKRVTVDELRPGDDRYARNVPPPSYRYAGSAKVAADRVLVRYPEVL